MPAGWLSTVLQECRPGVRLWHSHPEKDTQGWTLLCGLSTELMRAWFDGVCTCVCACTRVWTPHVNAGYLPLSFSTYYLRDGLSLSLG